MRPELVRWMSLRTLASATAGWVPPSIGWSLSSRRSRPRCTGMGARAMLAGRGVAPVDDTGAAAAVTMHEVDDGQAGGIPGSSMGQCRPARALTRNHQWRR